MPHPNKTIRLFNEHVYVIGDLHLGDGTRSDAFSLGDSVTKRDRMRALIKEIRENDGILIINGDCMDLQQGWSIDRVITANAILFRELSDLGKENKLVYIWSELDEDLSYYEELLNAQTASRVLILETEPTLSASQDNEDKDERSDVDENDSIEDVSEDLEDASIESEAGEMETTPVWAEMVQGFRFNPSINSATNVSLKGKSAHHLIERLLGTWIRFPLENFPTLENKVFFWILHKLDWLGQKSQNARLQRLVERAHANQIGNPNQVWTELHRQLESGEFIPSAPVLVLGHSNLPGVVPLDDQQTTFINTGSWIFDSQTVLHLEPASKRHTLYNWESKEEINEEPYAHLTSKHPVARSTLSGSFSLWWKRHYRGWLKFTFDPPVLSAQTDSGDTQ